jgi:putative chitinase
MHTIPGADTMITITPAMLRALAPRANSKLIGPICDAMNEFFPKFDITTENRVENFLAQACIETAYFKVLEEYASGDAYDTRTDLGNTAKRDGDGRLYKGRGIFQTTGRTNYKAAGIAMGIDALAHPELLATPRYAVWSACIYWKSRNLNALADRDDPKGITRKINGGTNALSARLAAREKCRTLVKSADPANDTIGPGSSHEAILSLQKLLATKKYPVGRADGKWGQMTRDAVLALKADNGLDTSHETITFAEAAAAPERMLEARQDATVADLRADGSTTVKGADKAQAAGAVGVALPFAGAGAKLLVGDGQGTPGALDKAEEYTGYWYRLKGVLEPFQDLLPWIQAHVWYIVPVIGAVAIIFGWRVKQKRLEDHIAGKVQ